VCQRDNWLKLIRSEIQSWPVVWCGGWWSGEMAGAIAQYRDGGW
jgi:hypothetical protein